MQVVISETDAFGAKSMARAYNPATSGVEKDVPWLLVDVLVVMLVPVDVLVTSKVSAAMYDPGATKSTV